MRDGPLQVLNEYQDRLILQRVTMIQVPAFSFYTHIKKGRIWKDFDYLMCPDVLNSNRGRLGPGSGGGSSYK